MWACRDAGVAMGKMWDTSAGLKVQLGRWGSRITVRVRVSTLPVLRNLLVATPISPHPRTLPIPQIIDFRVIVHYCDIITFLR